MAKFTPRQISTTWYVLSMGGFHLSLNAFWTTLMSKTFQTPKLWHKKGSLWSSSYLLILNILTNRSSYEAKRLCKKPSSNVSPFKLKNLIKRCPSHVWWHRRDWRRHLPKYFKFVFTLNTLTQGESLFILLR